MHIAGNDEATASECSQVVRSLCEALAAGREPSLPAGGGLARLLHEAGPSVREAVLHLAERWFGPTPELPIEETSPPLLNDERLDERAKLAALLVYHCGQHRTWMSLSTNESTFYRYRRAAFSALAERCCDEIRQRRIPTPLPGPDYDRFIGRNAERLELVRRLVGGPGGVTGIEGPGGTGKTALALSVARLCLEAVSEWCPVVLDGVAVPLFEAIVWAGSRQERLGLGDLLDLLARTLDYPGLLGRELPDRRAALRELLARRPVLIVLDDGDRSDPAVMDFLLELPAPSRALVTSRRRLPPRVTAIDPAPLSNEESLALLRHEGRRRLVNVFARAPDAVLQPLASATRRFPLLAVWAAGQLHQGQTLERVQARLAGGEGIAFDEMFAGSVEALSEDARQVLHVLPLFAAPSKRGAILAAAAGTRNAEAGMDDLLEASLIEATEGLTDAERRYALHPIPRAFVQQRLPIQGGQRRLALLSTTRYYRDQAARFAGSVQHWAGFDQIEAEIENILRMSEAVWQEAMLAGGDPETVTLDTTLVELAHELRNFFWLRHYWREGLEFFHHARDAAHRLGDRRGEGWNTYRLAYLHYELGTAGYREARSRAAEAVEILREAEDLRGAGHAMRLLGRAARERGDFELAWSTLEKSYELLARYGDGDDLAIVRASQADLLRRQGMFEDAAALYVDVLGSPLADPGTRATVLHQLGGIRLRQGDIETAQALFEQAGQVATEAGVRGIIARCRRDLALLAHRRGDEHLAATLSAEATELFERLGEDDPSAEFPVSAPDPR
jgi:tetratricopeptide (TPR) repeat protein